MINRIPFCFGNLMVRRKKIHKGCKESPKRLQKEQRTTLHLVTTTHIHHRIPNICFTGLLNDRRE